jgi:hypothetical protein
MRSKSQLYLLIIVALLMAACSPDPTPQPQQAPTETATATPTSGPDTPSEPSPTPTPTPAPLPQAGHTPTPELSGACAGLSGYLEVQILIGPSDAVGLEPIVVGELPFAVDGDTPPYPLSGATTLSYQDTLVEEWGSFDVQFNAGMAVDGSCLDTSTSGTRASASLEMAVTMDGEQLVTVTSEGFSGEYPWAGTHTLELVLPAETGATAQGEGWAFVLYLD